MVLALKKVIMESIGLPNTRRCDNCCYFQPDEWGTGHCQQHHMFVLGRHSCDDFAQRGQTLRKGGMTEQQSVQQAVM